MALILSPKIVITTCYNKRKPLKVDAELNTALRFNKAMLNFNILTLDRSSFRQWHLVTRDIAKDFSRPVSPCPPHSLKGKCKFEALWMSVSQSVIGKAWLWNLIHFGLRILISLTNKPYPGGYISQIPVGLFLLPITESLI